MGDEFGNHRNCGVSSMILESIDSLIEKLLPLGGGSSHPDRTQTILLLDAIKYRTEGHCPCVPKHNRSVNTICPCLEYRNGNTCRCGLFVKEGV